MKIALMGYARSGKDTVAEMIKEQCRPMGTLAFGNQLKVEFHNMFPHIPRDPKPRDGYEKFGQTMREIYPNVWIDRLEKSFHILQGSDIGVIITDLRQVNEAKWCKENGFAIVWVSSHPTIRSERSVDDAQYHDVNTSEEELWMIDYDYLIFNNGTKEQLAENVKSFIDELTEG